MQGTSKTLTPLEVRWMDGLARLGRHGADPSVFSQGHPTFHFLVLKQHFFPLRSYHCFYNLYVIHYILQDSTHFSFRTFFLGLIFQLQQELTVSLAWQAVGTGPNGNPADRDSFDMSSSSYRCFGLNKFWTEALTPKNAYPKMLAIFRYGHLLPYMYMYYMI